MSKAAQAKINEGLYEYFIERYCCMGWRYLNHSAIQEDLQEILMSAGDAVFESDDEDGVLALFLCDELELLFGKTVDVTNLQLHFANIWTVPE